ncbi:6-phosphogluconolactonase [Motiliproteus coralliicola]|uniref:6-phosphogluconolactonase n=1 Tax=Motiliproteus coralliicola TaxID=2283196 RepID=A0A369WV53_9GAMM|nr:6-phosphogluconolactonase [Motiliproteus coralliicola]RDE24416.1 6-phosphogluconolactonase [Motiliproteus coralliicola]
MSENVSTQHTPIRFQDRDALNLQLGREIAERLRIALDQRGHAALVVSGGRTPIGLFEALSRESLDWSRVVITLADERWVAPDSKDSNERLVREHLLQNQAGSARFIGLKTSAELAEDGAEACRARLGELPDRLDVVILGMGEDGHTASFFPGAEALFEALDPSTASACLSLTPPAAPHARMTLTLARLLRSEQIYLHLCGESKLPVLGQALQSGPVEQMPVRAVLRQHQVPLAIYWAP